MRSPFQFRRYGHSGIEVSELFMHTAECIDDICVVRSMHADVPMPSEVGGHMPGSAAAGRFRTAMMPLRKMMRRPPRV